MGVEVLLAEGRVGRALVFAGDEGVVLGEDVVIGALGEFRGHTRPPAKLVEVARASHVFKIEAKRAIGLAGRGRLAVAAAVGGLEAVAALHALERALRVFGISVGVDGIHRVAVGGPTHVGHLLFAARKAFQEQGGEAVVVVGAVGLHVAVVVVEAEARPDLGGSPHRLVAGQRLIVPRIAAVAVVVDFGGARVEDHPVQGDAPSGHHPGGRAALRGLRVGRDLEVVFLLGDSVRVAAVRELGDLVVGDAVGFDDALVALHRDRDFILGRRLGVCLVQGRAGGLDLGGFGVGPIG